MKKVRILILSYLFLTLFGCSFCTKETKPNYEWTFVHYFTGDSNGLALSLLDNLDDILAGYSENCNILLFIDLASDFEWSYNEKEYVGGGAFKIEKESLLQLDEKEIFGNNIKKPLSLDSANAEYLRDFIIYCKNKYPAKNYGMFLGGHGSGVSPRIYQKSRNILVDGSTSNWMSAKDLVFKLGSECFVNFLGLDLCFMSSVEYLYELRKGNAGFYADYGVASASEVLASGNDYKTFYFNFEYNMTPKEVGGLVLETQRQKSKTWGTTDLERRQTLLFADLSKIEDVKKNFDVLCGYLKDKKDFTENAIDETIFYFDKKDKEFYPFFDLYNFVDILGEGDLVLREVSNKVLASVDEMVIDSFGMSFYPNFLVGKMGLSIFYPYFSLYSWNSMMSGCLPFESDKRYEKLSWSVDGKESESGNWYSLLESWYKTSDENL